MIRATVPVIRLRRRRSYRGLKRVDPSTQSNSRHHNDVPTMCNTERLSHQTPERTTNNETIKHNRGDSRQLSGNQEGRHRELTQHDEKRGASSLVDRPVACMNKYVNTRDISASSTYTTPSAWLHLIHGIMSPQSGWFIKCEVARAQPAWKNDGLNDADAERLGTI